MYHKRTYTILVPKYLFPTLLCPLIFILKDKLEIEEAGESERASRSKWYSLRRPKLPRSIWEWNRNTDDEDDERASRRGIIE